MTRAILAMAVMTAAACNTTVHTDGVPAPAVGAAANIGGKSGQGHSAGATSRLNSAGGTANSLGKRGVPSSVEGGADGGSTQLVGQETFGGSVGGGVGSGGKVNTGGTAGVGGRTTAVNVNVGGTISLGGANNGGVASTGGKTNTGGVVSTGGRASTGGSVGTGGRVSTGGSVGTGGRVYSSGGTTAIGSGGCDQAKPFGAPVPIFPGTATSSETSISVQADGLSALISLQADVTDAASNLDLWRYFRSSIGEQFGNPMEMRGAENINTSADEGQVRLSRDGNDLYFTRTLADSTSAIYNAKRSSSSDDFPLPSRLDPLINFTATIGASWIAPDNSYFYWIAADQTLGLYRADVTPTGFGNRLAMAVINSTGAVMAPAFTDDQKTLYFASKGSDASGIEQVWRATRASATAPFGTPSRVAELADAQVRTYPQDVSPDGCILYLSKAVSSTSAERHLYQAVKPR